MHHHLWVAVVVVYNTALPKNTLKVSAIRAGTPANPVSMECGASNLSGWIYISLSLSLYIYIYIYIYVLGDPSWDRGQMGR